MTSLKPVFRRSSIVRQEVLLGKVSMKDYYDLNIKSIGKGSYGSVITARDLQTGEIRAVKILHKPKVEQFGRLKREISIMKCLDHPNIIRLFQVFEDEKMLYLVMELCTGGELFDRIVKSGHFLEHDAALIMKQILSAIAYCHQNDVMHRDIKPENLLYSNESPDSSLKVIDWGFATKCDKAHKFSSILGTPYYVAPEVLFGNYNKQCDLWSSGVILYILLSGCPPFPGNDNKEILRKVKLGQYSLEGKHWNTVSALGKELVRRLLCFEPDERITAAQALEHPWLKTYTNGEVQRHKCLNKRTGYVLLEKFKNFQQFMKLKKLALTVIAYQTAEKDITALHQVFSALDKNGDGVLTIAEVCAGLASMNIKYNNEIIDVLKELDTDGSGTIDFTEFIAASLDHKLYEKEDICRAAFRVFDLDNDGRITVNEMRKIFEMSFVREVFDHELIEKIIEEVDLNHDGIVDFEEFRNMLNMCEPTKKKFYMSIFKKDPLVYGKPG